MKTNNTTQELSKKEKYKLWYKAYYETNSDKIKEQKRKYRKTFYDANKEKIREEHKTYNTNNKEKRQEYTKKYIKKNTEYIREYQRSIYQKRKAYIEQYKVANKDKIKEYHKQRYRDKEEKIKAQCKEYSEKNKAQRLLYSRKWQSEKYANDSVYRLKKILRARIAAALNLKLIVKQGLVVELLGCTIDNARKHLESQWLEGMNWNNHSLEGWHIDHIKPVSTFDLTDPEQQKQCFHYTNLRPLWSHTNLSRPKDGSDISE
jgi:hypothetical protein